MKTHQITKRRLKRFFLCIPNFFVTFSDFKYFEINDVIHVYNVMLYFVWIIITFCFLNEYIDWLGKITRSR